MRSASRVVTLLIASLMAFQILLSAQTATTSLHGTVIDPKGAVLSGATVTITNTASGLTRTTKTDGEGAYHSWNCRLPRIRLR